ncbi:hypothetical protein ACFL5S_00800 [Fibrobacterota bacterium]
MAGRSPMEGNRDLRGKKLKAIREKLGYQSLQRYMESKFWKIVSAGFNKESLKQSKNYRGYEAGSRIIETDNLYKIAKELNVPVEIMNDEYDNLNAFKKVIERPCEKFLKDNNRLFSNEEIKKRILLNQIKQDAEGWEKNNFEYSYVEKVGAEYKKYANEKSIIKSVDNNTVKAFFLMISIHFKCDWKFWTIQNKNNPKAASALFQIFYKNYVRTNLRAFYALQYFKKELIQTELNKIIHSKLDSHIVNIIHNKVLKGDALSIVNKVASNKNSHIANKGKEVLAEIELLWSDSQNSIF